MMILEQRRLLTLEPPTEGLNVAFESGNSRHRAEIDPRLPIIIALDMSTS